MEKFRKEETEKRAALTREETARWNGLTLDEKEMELFGRRIDQEFCLLPSSGYLRIDDVTTSAMTRWM
jgi:hypothetical protein